MAAAKAAKAGAKGEEGDDDDGNQAAVARSSARAPAKKAAPVAKAAAKTAPKPAAKKVAAKKVAAKKVAGQSAEIRGGISDRMATELARQRQTAGAGDLLPSPSRRSAKASAVSREVWLLTIESARRRRFSTSTTRTVIASAHSSPIVNGWTR